ncbi:MAG: glycosyltransferase, partial [Promethearchaeota archaeon]
MIKVILLLKEPIRDYYFLRLNEEVEKRGIKLLFFKKYSKILPILRRVLSTKSRIVHIHWLFIAGFDSPNRFKVILNSLLLMADIFLLKYILKVKIIWTVHNMYHHESLHPYLEKIFKRVFIKRVDIVTCHCKQAKKRIHREFKAPLNKIVVIPHGNYIGCYENDISREEAREALKLDESDLVILYFGRIRPYKGVDYLLES